LALNSHLTVAGDLIKGGRVEVDLDQL
jgi:hypothetical protein